MVGIFAALDHPASAIGGLPQAEDRHEQLTPITALFCKVASPAIDFGRLW
jgi:hypothetical protein